MSATDTDTAPAWVRAIRAHIAMGETWASLRQHEQAHIADLYLTRQQIGLGDVFPLHYDRIIMGALARDPDGLLGDGAAAVGWMIRAAMIVYVEGRIVDRWRDELAEIDDRRDEE